MPATTFQYATPASIIGSTYWSGAVSSVDEQPPFNDSDVMTSPPNTVGPPAMWPIEFQLSTPGDPHYYTDGFSVIIRAAKSNTDTQTITFRLKQGSTIITASTFTLTTTQTTQSQALISAEISTINFASLSSLSLEITAQPPVGSGYVILSGCAFQLPSVGFNHLVSSTSGFKIEGAHSGHVMKPRTGGAGYLVGTGSESSGCLIPAANGLVQVKN